MSKLGQVLRYAKLWLIPPKLSAIQEVEIEAEKLEQAEPVFVFSTGRCGTKWLSVLLRNDARIRVNHNDYPELIRHSRMAYESYDAQPELFQEVLRACRDGYVLGAYQRNRVYVETNHRITFFSYAIEKVYPRAKYVHLVRHPGDVVRSGLRRDWYNGALHDGQRIRCANQEQWHAMSRISKIAWLWNETNKHIEEFLSPVERSRFMRIKSEDMFSDVAACQQLARFVGAEIQDSTIVRSQRRKENRQLLGNVPAYEQWAEDDRRELRRFVPLHSRYGYEV